MILSKKVFALASGVVASLALVATAQQPNPPARPASPGDSLIVGGTIQWHETSEVSALREGVIEKIEYQIGNRVEAGKPIGYLHKKMAELTARKAQVAAENVGPIKSAEAKKDLAASEVARLRRLEKMGPAYVSVSEIEKSEAELLVAKAQIREAQENQKVAQAEQDIANEIVEEHTILAPFNGIVTDRHKNPGEAVRANEAVVRLGRTDKLRFVGYLALESAPRVQVGDNVEVKATVDGAALPIEQKTFYGKVISVSREAQIKLREAQVQIVAEVNNAEDEANSELSLRPGIKGEMKVLLRTAAPAGTTVGLKTGR